MRHDSAPTSAIDPLRRWIAVGGGLGYAPLASGTFGSLPGLALAWGLTRIGGWPLLLAGTVATSVIGIWAADAMARAVGRTDPGEVVEAVAGAAAPHAVAHPPDCLEVASLERLAKRAQVVTPVVEERWNGRLELAVHAHQDRWIRARGLLARRGVAHPAQRGDGLDQERPA